MILFLAAEYTSIFNILRKACFSLNQRVKLFCVIRKFLPANVWATFYLILLHLSIQILTL